MKRKQNRTPGASYACNEAQTWEDLEKRKSPKDNSSWETSLQLFGTPPPGRLNIASRPIILSSQSFLKDAG